MLLDLTYDATTASAPAGFRVALAYAADILDRAILTPITVNVTVSFTDLHGALGEGGGTSDTLPYADIVAALAAHATSDAARQAVAALPRTSDPSGGLGLQVALADQKALGMLLPRRPGTDGTVAFDATAPFNYSTTDRAVPGEYDFVGAALHELTHALGRSSAAQLMDLFKYTAPGVLENKISEPSYFSTDGGRTALDAFDITSDAADWAASVGHDAFGAVATPGVENVLSATDLTLMSMLGYAIACFAAGTRVATPAGPVAVEALRQGDRVCLASGGSLPVIWLGHRRVDCRRHPRPESVWPYCVAAHAFAPGRPARDLLLSPDHAIAIGGALIPVHALANGRTVAQLPCAAITYWHVELPRHAVILAEGLACESYLDTGNRAAFANGGGAVRLHPDFTGRARHATCAPLLIEGPAVTAARSALLRRAAALGHPTTPDPWLRVSADGQTLPTDYRTRFWRVAVPVGTACLRLRSRAWVPAHTRADETDTRQLGIAVSRLWLDGRAVALDSAGLASGWHAAEPGWRWTDGDAVLRPYGATEIVFEIVMAGTYWRDGAATPSPERLSRTRPGP